MTAAVTNPQPPAMSTPGDPVGGHLRRARERLGMGRRQLSARTGVHVDTIASIENGHPASVEQIASLTAALTRYATRP